MFPGNVYTDTDEHSHAALDPGQIPQEKKRGSGPEIGMVDSYLSGVTSTSVTPAGSGGFNHDRKVSFAAVAGQETSAMNDDDQRLESLQDEEYDMGVLSTSLPEAPREMPGLSIITWEEFIEEPSLLHNLFTLDKKEFIHFDSSVVNNFFHDSRMDPPILGGPSGDGLSWTIFIDNYSQLRQVRDTMTTRISVLLVDLVKPNKAGTASCLVAINPNDDHIRRVLHLTLSRAMESLHANKGFSVEIDLTNSVQEWTKSVLQINCAVTGGRIVITNGDAPENCCEVDDVKFCALCFPIWAFRRIRYMIRRRNRYDDTRIEFESSNLVLCTKSDTLRQYAEAAQMSYGERIIMKNKHSTTMATQTVNDSTTSLQSDMSVQEVEGAPDNDVSQHRTVLTDERGDNCYDYSAGGFDNPNFVENDSAITYTKNPTYSAQNSSGMGNPAFEDDDGVKKPEPVKSIISNQGLKEGLEKVGQKKNKSVMFLQTSELANSTEEAESAEEVEAVAQANTEFQIESSSNTNISQSPNFLPNGISFCDDTPEQLPSPRSEFLSRPDTPFRPRIKPRKAQEVTDPQSTGIFRKLPLDTDEPLDNRAQTTSNKYSMPVKVNTEINDKIARRQRKIGLLLKDLVLSSNSGSKSKGQDQVINNSTDDGPMKADHTLLAHLYDNSSKTPKKVKKTPVKGWNSKEDKIFPYTTDLLNFPALSPELSEDSLEKYGAKKKKGKDKKKAQSRTEDMLFRPRMNLDAFAPDRNCFSDQDIADSDITDLETDQENAMSDTEGITSSRLIPVQNTNRTISMDSVNDKSDTDLEITDCEIEEEELSKRIRGPRILPGAQAAHEMRGSSAGGARARSRDYIPPSAQARRRGGSQNDSRRRYLALNSLRRKAYQLSLQSQVKTQKQTQSRTAELLSYNARNANFAVISHV